MKRPVCSRCGSDRVRSRNGGALFTCQQSLGPCGFRWTHGRPKDVEYFDRTVTRADGTEDHFHSPAHIEGLGADPGPGATGSARMGAALFAATRVLEVVKP